MVSIYSDKGLCGLMNLGNTCYMNSILQILSHTYELREGIKNAKIIDNNNSSNNSRNRSNKKNTQLLKEWILLLEEQISNKEGISPTSFFREFQKYAIENKMENFIGFQQNDASEFLILFMDYLHESIGYSVNMNVRGVIKNEKDELAKLCYDKMKEMYNEKYSELIRIFYGFTITEITSIKSNKSIIKTSQPFFMLNLPIPVEKKEVTLTDCLNSYLVCDTITYSHDGQSEDCYKHLKICNLPDILIISFNRFNHMNRKNHKTIYFPFDNLDLNAYVHGYNENKEFMYDLYGICNHSGSSLGGHYTSMVKNANGNWYNFNDRIVNKLEINIQHLYAKAYVLFYRKKKQ